MDIINELNSIITANPKLLTCLGFLIGTLLGDRLAIGRDKRIEFNEASHPIRAWILNEIKNPIPYSIPPDTVQIDLFENYLHFWEKYRFSYFYKLQNKERSLTMRRDDMGSCYYENNSNIIKSLKKCLPYTKRR